ASLMGGSISISSEPGKGTTVTLILPLPVAEPQQLRTDARETASSAAIIARPDPPSVDQAARDGTLVLVVDDHPINRLVVMRQVNMLGYATETAEDGRKALEKWQSGRYRL